MKVTDHSGTHGTYRELEWEAGDLSSYGSRNERDTGNKFRKQLLVGASLQAASYFMGIAESGHASDDDTDYINSHAELMLAVNDFWYDEVEDKLIEWLNVWATAVYPEDDDYGIESELGNPARLNAFILRHISS